MFHIFKPHPVDKQKTQYHPPPSLLRYVLGEGTAAQLPKAVLALHDAPPLAPATLVAMGQARVNGATGPLPHLLRRLFGLPQPGHYPALKVTLSTTAAGQEIWTRQFSPTNTLVSQLSAGTGRNKSLIVERFGPFRFGTAWCVRDGALWITPRTIDLLGVPLPRLFLPTGDSRASQDADGTYAFDVVIDLPLIGTLVRYQGRLVLGRASAKAAGIQDTTTKAPKAQSE